jgi:hypothetical protein
MAIIFKGIPSTNEPGDLYENKSSRFDLLVAQHYPAVYSFATRLTDDYRDAIALTRNAFGSARKQAQNRRNPTAIAIALVSAEAQAIALRALASQPAALDQSRALCR